MADTTSVSAAAPMAIGFLSLLKNPAWIEAAAAMIGALGTLAIAVVGGWWTWMRRKESIAAEKRREREERALRESREREERALLKRREMESLEGDMTFTVHGYDSARKLVAIEMIWENKGVEPVAAIREKSGEEGRRRTCIEIMAIPDGLPDGAHVNRAWFKGEPLSARLFPFEGEDVVLEPKTRSLFREHVVLPAGRDYLVHWRLEGRKDEDFWTKERVVSLRPGGDPGIPEGPGPGTR